MNKSAIDNHKFLTQAPVSRVIPRLAIPTIVSMLTTSVYNIADTYFVSQIGTEATVAVGLSFTLMTLLQAVGFFIGQGTGNFIAIRLGAKDSESPRYMVSSGLMYALLFGLLISISGLFAINRLCTLLGGSDKVMPYMKEYMVMMLLSAPFIILSLTLSLQIRMQGKAKYSMIGIICGMVLNILLDSLFIITFGWGVGGAGLATLVSQIISCSILLRITYANGLISPAFSKISFAKKYIKEMFAGGMPSLLRQGLGCIVVLSLNISASYYGDNVVAGMTIMTRITFLLLSVITGLGQGFQPLCGFSYGAGLYSRIQDGFRFTVRIATIFLVTSGILGYVFAHEIMLMFSTDVDTITVGSNALRWQFLAFPIEGVVIIGSIFLQTINRTYVANIMAAAKKGLFFIPLIVILPSFYGVCGIEMCQAASDICTFLIAVPILSKTFSELTRSNSTQQYTT